MKKTLKPMIFIVLLLMLLAFTTSCRPKYENATEQNKTNAGDQKNPDKADGTGNNNGEDSEIPQKPATDNSENTPDGTTHIEQLPEGVNLDALAKKSYELAYCFGQLSFEKPEDISINVLVQYAFCYLFCDKPALTDMPKKNGMGELRQATVDEIKTVLKKFFYISDVDVTKSDLYNKGKNIFEMWEPNYSTDVFYNSSCYKLDDVTYIVKSTFYTTKNNDIPKGSTQLTIKLTESGPSILKLSSK